jgi:hypothetical protein
MGRFFVILGIILMIIGFAAPMFSMGGLFSSLDPMLNLATDSDTREAELCKEGEHLEEEQGAESYSPTTGYGHSITAYCVDEDGDRRDVTAEFVAQLLGVELDENGNLPTDADAMMETFMGGDLMSGITDTIGQSLMFAGLGVVGTFLMVIGMIMSLGGRRKNMMVMNPYNASFTPMQPTNMSGFGSPISGNPSSFGSPVQPNTSNTLAAQLQQLEQAYNQSLITREEYDKARQNLLNGMK